MKELDLAEYESLRGSGEKLIGRIVPRDNDKDVIYYQVDKEQKNFSCTEILDTLKLIHPELKGYYDVIRHWTQPEIKTIKYIL